MFKNLRERLFLLKANRMVYLMSIWLIIMVVAIFIQFIFYILSYFVYHENGGFYYFFRGIFFLIISSRSEPNSSQGFIFAGFILGYVPFLISIFVVYYYFMQWFLYQKIIGLDIFKHMPISTYKLVITTVHFGIWSGLFLSIPAIVLGISGYDTRPQFAFKAFENINSDEFSNQIVFGFCFIYYMFGWISILIVFLIFIWFIFKIIAHYIALGIGMFFKAFISIFKKQIDDEDNDE